VLIPPSPQKDLSKRIKTLQIIDFEGFFCFWSFTKWPQTYQNVGASFGALILSKKPLTRIHNPKLLCLILMERHVIIRKKFSFLKKDSSKNSRYLL